MMGVEHMILGSLSAVSIFKQLDAASLCADHLTQDDLQLRPRNVVDEFLVKESHP